jgi:hypothetical protein
VPGRAGAALGPAAFAENPLRIILFRPPWPDHRSQAAPKSVSGRKAHAESGALLEIQGQNSPKDP